jgi:hypothetical protein
MAVPWEGGVRMFNSGVLDVAVGLTFLYLLLSLIGTAISEIIESKLKMRAVDLERGVRAIAGSAVLVRCSEQDHRGPVHGEAQGEESR